MYKNYRAPHPYRFVFAENLRKIRRFKNFSQEELSFRSELSKTYISEVETGNRSISVDAMGRLADALNLPLEIFLMKELPFYVCDDKLPFPYDEAPQKGDN